MYSQLLSEALSINGLAITEKAKGQLNAYLMLLKAWNRVFNLTAITKPRDMVYLHIVDSLIVNPYLQGNNILDVGSGAGLPGIPLAIINPKKNWVLLDKNSKKTRFLTQSIAELQLTNVKIVQKRMEDFHTAVCFDTILSRALSSLAGFIKATEHLLCQNG